MSGWGVLHHADRFEVHVYPVEDLRPHVIDGGPCWCGPREDADPCVIIHNSLDKREEYERGRPAS